MHYDLLSEGRDCGNALVEVERTKGKIRKILYSLGPHIENSWQIGRQLFYYVITSL
jgi:hypothetical protein